MNTSTSQRQQLERLYQTLLQQLEQLKSSENFERLDADLVRDTLRHLYRALDDIKFGSQTVNSVKQELSAPVSFSPTAQEVQKVQEVQEVQEVQTVQEVQGVQPVQEVQAVQIVQEVQEVQIVQAVQEVQGVQPVQEVPNVVQGVESVQEVQSVKDDVNIPEPVLNQVVHEPVRSDLQEARKTVYTETLAKASQSGATIGSSYTAMESLSDRIAQNGQPTRLSEQLQSKPLEDLRLSIGLNERFAFINSLFEGNQQSFYSAVDRLNNSSSFPDAQKELDTLQSNYGWDNNNHRFTEFSELVKRRFGV